MSILSDRFAAVAQEIAVVIRLPAGRAEMLGQFQALTLIIR